MLDDSTNNKIAHCWAKTFHQRDERKIFHTPYCKACPQSARKSSRSRRSASATARSLKNGWVERLCHGWPTGVKVPYLACLDLLYVSARNFVGPSEVLGINQHPNETEQHRQNRD